MTRLYVPRIGIRHPITLGLPVMHKLYPKDGKIAMEPQLAYGRPKEFVLIDRVDFSGWASPCFLPDGCVYSYGGFFIEYSGDLSWMNG